MNGKGKSTDALGAMVVAVTRERAADLATLELPTKQHTDAIKCKISGPTRHKIAGRNAGKGKGGGRAWRNGRSGASSKGRWPGYSMRPKATKLSLCLPRQNPTVCWYQEKSNSMLVPRCSRMIVLVQV